MVRFRRLAALLVLSAPLFYAAGCSQGAGERCQTQDDCADNLLCILPAGGTPQAGGLCEPPNSLQGDLSMPDLAVTIKPFDMTTSTTPDGG
jgi:hypothetical protein